MPHFEIHATDVNATKSFDDGLFGLSFTAMLGGEDVQGNIVGKITPAAGGN